MAAAASTPAPEPLTTNPSSCLPPLQVGFFDIVVIPLYSTFSRVFHSSKPMLTYVMRNYKHWTEVQRKEVAASK